MKEAEKVAEKMMDMEKAVYPTLQRIQGKFRVNL